MKRIDRGWLWLFAGLTALDLPGVSLSYGQSSAQGGAPYASASPQGIGVESGQGGPPSSYPRGSTSVFPQADRSPGGGASASPQAPIARHGSAGSPIPPPRRAGSFPRGHVAMTGPTAMASPQGTGAVDFVPGARPDVASGAQVPGPAGPSGQFGGGAGAGAPPQVGAAGEMPGAGLEAGAAGIGAAPGAAGAAEAPGALTSPIEATTAPPENVSSSVLEEALAGFAPETTAGAQAAFNPTMIGDMSPFYSRTALAAGHSPPPVRGPRAGALFYPSVRNFKMSENQSPIPMDRVFWDYNFYTNLNSTVNTAEKTPINRMNGYVYTWGFEKTFDQGNGSFGMRLPLDTLTAQSNSVATPTSTALGNLNIFLKYVLKGNVETGRLYTVGMMITPPTGTSRFAGAPYVVGLNTTYFQPFIAYLWRYERFYLQGFSGFDFPSSNSDVTLMYNDVGFGYFLYQNPDPSRLITAIAPTFEIHVDSPLNHRNPFNSFDPAASPYVCNFTYGLNVLMYGRAQVTTALVTPVTNPKPFDCEFALQLNFYFGRTARRPAQIVPPSI